MHCLCLSDQAYENKYHIKQNHSSESMLLQQHITHFTLMKNNDNFNTAHTDWHTHEQEQMLENEPSKNIIQKDKWNVC